jgi:hypothetical protein
MAEFEGDRRASRSMTRNLLRHPAKEAGGRGAHFPGGLRILAVSAWISRGTGAAITARRGLLRPRPAVIALGRRARAAPGNFLFEEGFHGPLPRFPLCSSVRARAPWLDFARLRRVDDKWAERPFKRTGDNMRRWWLSVVVLPPIVAFFACGGSQQQANNNAGSDVCPLVDPGPPPVCPEGCTWDGEECRKHSGVLIIDSRRDGGRSGPSSDQPEQPESPTP